MLMPWPRAFSSSVLGVNVKSLGVLCFLLASLLKRGDRRDDGWPVLVLLAGYSNTCYVMGYCAMISDWIFRCECVLAGGCPL